MAQGESIRSNLPSADAKGPVFTAEDIRSQLRRYDRGPFLDLLAAWMECAPDVEDVLSLATRKPELWVKALTDLSRMAGYTDKTEVTHTHKLEKLSDSQLEDRARAYARQFALEANTIDLESEPE